MSICKLFYVSLLSIFRLKYVKISSCSQLGSLEDLEASPPKHPQHANSPQIHDNPNSSKPNCPGTGIATVPCFKRATGRPSDFGVEPSQCSPVTQRSLLRTEKAQRWRRISGRKKEVNLGSSKDGNGWKWLEIIPIPSMHGIFTYIWLIFMVNVGKYTIHGSYGNENGKWMNNPWFSRSLRLRLLAPFSNCCWWPLNLLVSPGHPTPWSITYILLLKVLYKLLICTTFGEKIASLAPLINWSLTRMPLNIRQKKLPHSRLLLNASQGFLSTPEHWDAMTLFKHGLRTCLISLYSLFLV